MDVDDLVIGIDGGGTKTIACIAIRSTQTILGRGVSGPCNPRAVGFPVAFENLNEAVDAAFNDSNLNRATVAKACLGIAGADREEEQRLIRDWSLQVSLADEVQIINDALPVLYAANPAGVGIALISGTGSFAYGRDAHGNTARCGGWGYLFGDEGSGYAIAIAGLKAAARKADGRGPHTQLLERYLQRLELSNASDLIPKIYSSEYDRRAIAKLAELVFEANASGDTVATEIVHQAASELAQLVQTLRVQLNFHDEASLALTGGVLLNYEVLREELLCELSNRVQKVSSAVLVSDPVIGSVRVASG